MATFESLFDEAQPDLQQMYEPFHDETPSVAQDPHESLQDDLSGPWMVRDEADTPFDVLEWDKPGNGLLLSTQDLPVVYPSPAPQPLLPFWHPRFVPNNVSHWWLVRRDRAY